MTETATDPLSLRFSEQRYFEDFRVGEGYYIPSRTVTEGVFSAFTTGTGAEHMGTGVSWRTASRWSSRPASAPAPWRI